MQKSVTQIVALFIPADKSISVTENVKERTHQKEGNLQADFKLQYSQSIFGGKKNNIFFKCISFPWFQRVLEIQRYPVFKKSKFF